MLWPSTLLDRCIFCIRQYCRLWNAKIQTHVIRYEDLRSNTLLETLRILSFILPEEERPDTEDAACAVEDDPDQVSRGYRQLIATCDVSATGRYLLT